MKIEELRKICQPEHKSQIDPLMEWHVLRPFSIYLTWFFTKLGFSANTISFFGLCFGVTGSLLFLWLDNLLAFIGALMIWFGFFLDCVDGEVARFNRKSSVKGIYLDYFVGGVNDMAIFFCLGFYVAAVNDWDMHWILGLSVGCAYLEKIIGLYSHSVIVRNLKSYVFECQSKSSVNDQAATKVLFKRMSLWQRLIRVPFETFFRATMIVAAGFLDFVTSSAIFMTFVWGLSVSLSVLVILKSFYSEFFGNRVEVGMREFADDLGLK